MQTGAHRFRFFRAGGFDQVIIDRGEDILALEQLDQKLWGALSCPTTGLEFDEETLASIDSDRDGRIRAPDIIAAAKWAGRMLRDPDDLVRGGDTLPLAAIDEEHPEGKKLLASARRILKGLGKRDADSISLADVSDQARIYTQLRFNGDGIVPPQSAPDEVVAAALGEIIDCVGGELDRSGAIGVSRAKADAFFEAARAYEGWWKEAETRKDSMLPLGEATADAFRIVSTIRTKIDDWFTRSRLAAFDPRALGPLNRDEAEYVAIAPRLLSVAGEEVASFPLAKVTPGGDLPLVDGLNPAWVDRIRSFRTKVVEPLLGERGSLTVEEWRSILASFGAFEKWSAAKPGAEVEKLGIQRVREILAGELRSSIEALIEKDASLEPEIAAIDSVERLIRYKRDLYTLLCNFVSFSEFYSKRKAVFQAGTLYLDGRSCDLCVRVSDANAHANIASASGTYLAYCECTRKSDGKKMIIAAAFTDGAAENLVVGRNGLFYDRKGADWDATIVKIVEHPISIREAFWRPYQRIARLIGEQIDRLASAREKAIQAEAATSIESAAGKIEDKGAEGPKSQAFDVAKFAGIFAAIGLAIGAIGSTLAAIATGFLSLPWWKMPLAILGVMLLVSGPSMILAWLKLRGRSLGPILDANGWAVNTHAKINIPFGASLTSVATLPPQAERSLHDPFAPRRPWVAWVVILVLAGLGGLAWYGGWLGGGEESAPSVVSDEEAGEPPAP